MNQPQFLFRAKTERGYRIFQSGDQAQSPIVARRRLHISFRPIYERVDSLSRRDTGRRDRKQLYLVRGGPVIYSVVVPNSAAGVKSVLRRLRAQEAERLDAIDGKIAEHEAAIKQLKAERETTLHEAWQRANVVRLQEVVPEAEAEAERAQARRSQ